MIVEFTVKNFRSIKEETSLSLEASGAKGKSDNVIEVETPNGKVFRLLKTAVIYGPNASGKSNIIRAFYTFRYLIAYSFRNDVNDDLNLAEPFELDTESVNEPTEFKLNFIGWDKQQYIYHVAFSKKNGIVEESLKYYPEKYPKTIYKRKGRKVEMINAELIKGRNETDTINPKRLYLSELGNSGDEYWEGLRNYFVIGSNVLNTSINGMFPRLTENAKRIFDSNDEEDIEIKNKVIRLVQLSDLGINGLSLIEEEELMKNPGAAINLADDSYSGVRKIKRFKTRHSVYSNKEYSGEKEFDLIQQGSTGSLAIIGISTEIIMSLCFPNSRPLWIDEIDNSLHPYLCRFIINLFNHPKSNPNNSQLIFATHETTLLDKNNFRKDQIWITVKDKFGCTKLYSVYDLDIEGLRDDIPFDKWYMSGKFGGIPNIKELDFIFERNNE